jgi:HPt (histidine-containing phosphotransfer) domain-containing protein
MSASIQAPDATVPVLDRSRLLDEFGDDPAVLAELLAVFLEHIPPLLDAICGALQEGDCPAVARHAHSLKGASSTYGALRLAHVAGALEALARQGRPADAAGATQLLERELADFQRALNPHHRTPVSP